MFIKINKKILLIIALLIPLGLFSNNTTEADAWGWYAHQSLPVVAAGFLKNTNDLGEFGDRWADLFQIYESDLKLGGTYPDRVLGDSSNHVYHVLENVQMFKKTPDVVRLRYEAFKNKLITGNYSGAVFEAGVMSHYITDICNPMH
ncbi:MAG: hypothetical protein ACC656_14165, partial [Candidatus Heimdallarchaeota archaeon]